MKSKNLLKRKSFIIGVSMFIVASLNFVNAQCDNPTFTEGADRSYAAGDIISRDGKDYKVKVAGWANASISDGYYAPGSGSVWAQAWDLENDPCTNTGGGNNNGDGNGDGSGNGDGNGGDGNSGGGGGSGASCSTTKDDGQAEATFYNLIANGSSTTVKCSFDVVNDIKGTNYGALETATLQVDGDAKYCGMCVEMTGIEGTANVHIVDECPDCYHHNVGDTDVDLSPSAFAAVVGDQSIGRSSITWEEVSCPWQTPLHLIMQGSHDWYAKVIVGNHVNRIATVEISNDGGSSWESMTRGVDNGFEKGSYGGTNKSFKITDIYGDILIMNDINMVSNGNAKVVGTENFDACSLVSSKGLPNSLDYVSAFPNPANSSITFVGLEGVNSMEILNLNGQVVASQNFQSRAAQISLDVSYFAPGIYVAKMTGDSETGIVTFVKK